MPDTIKKAEPNLYLIGMPGAGKSTLGRLLAQRLNRTFMDLDAAIEADAGLDIPALFATRGEQFFRDLEARALAEAAAQSGLVVATGGGVVLREANVQIMRDTGIVLWLHRPLSALLKTVGGEGDRPLLAGDAAGKLRTLYAQRIPLYEQAASLRVKNTGNIEGVVQACLRGLRGKVTFFEEGACGASAPPLSAGEHQDEG